jgi:hypothetical protein
MSPPPRHRQRAALLAISCVAFCTARAFADEPLPASVTYTASASCRHGQWRQLLRHGMQRTSRASALLPLLRQCEHHSRNQSLRRQTLHREQLPRGGPADGRRRMRGTAGLLHPVAHQRRRRQMPVHGQRSDRYAELRGCGASGRRDRRRHLPAIQAARRSWNVLAAVGWALPAVGYGLRMPWQHRNPMPDPKAFRGMTRSAAHASAPAPSR